LTGCYLLLPQSILGNHPGEDHFRLGYSLLLLLPDQTLVLLQGLLLPLLPIQIPVLLQGLRLGRVGLRSCFFMSLESQNAPFLDGLSLSPSVSLNLFGAGLPDR
jgi:hypothetical protein